MGMRSSDATFLRREVLPILERTSAISPDAEDALARLRERLEEGARVGEAPADTTARFVKRMIRHDGQWAGELEVEGWLVPYVVVTGNADGATWMTLDGRFSVAVDDDRSDEFQHWAWFMAHAMAVSAGRTSHGEHSYVRNPHGRSGAGDPPPTGATVIKGRCGNCGQVTDTLPCPHCGTGMTMNLGSATEG